jgi:hypothetical protein
MKISSEVVPRKKYGKALFRDTSRYIYPSKDYYQIMASTLNP